MTHFGESRASSISPSSEPEQTCQLGCQTGSDREFVKGERAYERSKLITITTEWGIAPTPGRVKPIGLGTDAPDPFGLGGKKRRGAR